MKHKITLNVRNRRKLTFEAGLLTGNMKESGIAVRYQDNQLKYEGGILSRKQAEELRDFLSEVILKWSLVSF